MGNDARSDEQLARKMFAGDEGATRALLDRHRSRLYGFLVRLCGDRTEAEDLFQETFLRAIRSSGGFDIRRRFKPWIYAIALNLARDRARRLAHTSTPRVGQDASLPEPARDGPTDRRENEWIRRADLLAALDELPEPMRAVVLLRYFDGMEEAEIAAVLGIPRGTVKSRLHRSLRTLRTRLRQR